MSSLPNPSHLSSTPVSGQRHRHRRSAAISGDFDSLGLGLFSPPNTAGSFSSNAKNDTDENLVNDFNFNNDDDFTNRPKRDKFSFPNSTPDLSAPSSPFQHHSHSRKTNSLSLNSPIRMNHSRSTSNTPGGTRFFATEETHYNNENVPEAVIDLDKVLNARLYVSNRSPSHKRTESAPADMFCSDELLCSPFMRSNAGPYVSSPASVNPLFHQPIQEQTTVEEEEEEKEKGDEENENIDFLASDNDDLFVNPQDALSALYSNSSANSSSSSLRSSTRTPSAHFIEKTLSNSSKESYNIGQSTSKRSGAMANRYQTIYDQSYKISNALRISSSESINIIRSNSNGSTFNPVKDARLLGHSSSLPSLKSNPKRNVIMNPSRFSDFKSKQPEIKKSSSNLASSTSNGIGQDEVSSRSSFTTLSNTNSNKTETFMDVLDNSCLTIKESNRSISSFKGPNQIPDEYNEHFSPKVHSITVSGKAVTNSPISTNSDMSSAVLSISGTIQSTDSSLTSHVDSNRPNKLKQRDAQVVGKDTPSIVISTTTSVNSPLTNISKDKYCVMKEPNSKFSIDDPLNNSQHESSQDIPSRQSGKVASNSSDMNYSSSRIVHSSQERVLNSTRIPFHKFSKNRPNRTIQSTSSTPKPTSNKFTGTYNHTKSRSLHNFSSDSLRPRSNSNDDTSSLKIRYRKDKLLNWFKRNKES